MYVCTYVYICAWVYICKSELIGWFFVQFDFGLLHGWQLQLDRVDGALWDVCLEADAVAAAAVATAAGAGVVGVSCCCFWVNYFHFLVLFVFSRFGCLLLLLLLLLLWLLRWLVVVVAAAVVFCCSFDLSCNDVMIGKSMLTVMHFLTF